ncbi:hypothetical protein E2C01_083926 [Portunus trituberculatus]|uniref:Uncharacterized protein n=1 Tax=Portunus trituberculatus TaxID=210409 RepID=A0A5B7J7V0_PORTR|nr:hypothetical protein [Portunus trituberculatus]
MSGLLTTPTCRQIVREEEEEEEEEEESNVNERNKSKKTSATRTANSHSTSEQRNLTNARRKHRSGQHAHFTGDNLHIFRS